MQALYEKYGMDSYGNMLGVQTEEFKVDYSWLSQGNWSMLTGGLAQQAESERVSTLMAVGGYDADDGNTYIDNGNGISVYDTQSYRAMEAAERAARQAARGEGLLSRLGGSIRSFVASLNPNNRYNLHLGRVNRLNISSKGGESIESLVRYVNSKPIGFTMTGDDLADRDSKLSLASNFVDNIQKVSGGIQVHFTFAGKLAIKASPHTIPNGTTFNIQSVTMGDKSPALRITAPGALLFGEQFNVYLRGNTYSRYGKQFFPIFK